MGSLEYLVRAGFHSDTSEPKVRALDMSAAKKMNSTPYLRTTSEAIPGCAGEHLKWRYRDSVRLFGPSVAEAQEAVNAAAQLNISGAGLCDVVDARPAAPAPGTCEHFATDAPGRSMAEMGR